MRTWDDNETPSMMNYADYWFHQDDMGNVIALTDESGAVVEYYLYDDFGVPMAFEPDGDYSSTTPISPFLFTGQMWDGDAKLYYCRMRWYDPYLGRFTSRDPLGLWGDPLNLGNGQAYVGHSPWSWVDPYGLQAFFGMTEYECAQAFDWDTHQEDMRGAINHPLTTASGNMLMGGVEAGGGLAMTVGTSGVGAVGGIPLMGMGIGQATLGFAQGVEYFKGGDPNSIPSTVPDAIRADAPDSALAEGIAGTLEVAQVGLGGYGALKGVQAARGASELAAAKAAKGAADEIPYHNPVRIHADSQGKHIPGHKNFIEGRSELTHPNPQELIDRFSGTGRRIDHAKEVVDFGTDIGTYVDGPTRIPTTRGTIHTRANGECHIVPASPRSN